MVFFGLSFQPEEVEDGKCSAKRPNNVECIKTGRSSSAQIDTAFFTGSNGTVLVCDKFLLAGQCEGSVFSGATSDADLVLDGEVRDCKMKPNGHCVEPGMYHGAIAGAICAYIGGALFFIASCCAALAIGFSDEEEETDKEDESDEEAHHSGTIQGFIED